MKNSVCFKFISSIFCMILEETLSYKGGKKQNGSERHVAACCVIIIIYIILDTDTSYWNWHVAACCVSIFIVYGIIDTIIITDTSIWNCRVDDDVNIIQGIFLRLCTIWQFGAHVFCFFYQVSIVSFVCTVMKKTANSNSILIVQKIV